ncbi:MAG: CPBP family intramembrane glutamic endopeptidase [Bacteroidota bacterium]
MPDPATLPPDAPAPLDATPVLRDAVPWAKPVRLNGLLERQRFHPLLMALMTFVGGFVVYQLVGSVVMIVAALGETGGGLDMEAVLESLEDNALALFGGNALGQAAGFLGFVLFVAWLHTRDTASFLRVRRSDGVHLGLSALGLLALLPLVAWLGALNADLPLPESWRAWDAQQVALIERVLGAEMNVLVTLLLVAVTPAVCEEVMFRGYLQRQVERSFGVAASVVLVGVLFGAFHLRPTQLLPLATLGLYMGFAVWVTGSLWAGVLVHLLNNGLAVVVSDYLARRPGPDLVALDAIAVPWYLAVLSAGATTGIVVLLLRRRRALLIRET